MKKDLPIICVNINKSRSKDNLCPSWLNDELAIFIPFGSKIIQYALENWPSSYSSYRKQGKTGAYHYKDSVYENL